MWVIFGKIILAIAFVQDAILVLRTNCWS